MKRFVTLFALSLVLTIPAVGVGAEEGGPAKIRAATAGSLPSSGLSGSTSTRRGGLLDPLGAKTPEFTAVVSAVVQPEAVPVISQLKEWVGLVMPRSLKAFLIEG